jgi:hypothetical protein
MEMIEIIRVIIGIVLIAFGLGVNYYEKFHDMKYIDQRNGVLNGKVAVFAGVLISAYTVKIGIIVAIISFALVIAEEIMLNRKINKTK